jgi:putative hydrolase of the HAD superfamily
MVNHNINPKKYLEYVHDIDFSIIKPDKELNDLIKKVHGKKIVFTNADIVYAKKILKNLDLINIFDDIYDIERMNFLPKPNLQTYKKLIATYNLDVKKAILFDDIPQNLIPAADLGLKTVQVYNKKLLKELNGTSKKIDYMTNNLKEWLQKWMLNN